MSTYSITTRKTWAQTRDALTETMSKWGVVDWNIIPPAGLTPSQLTTYQYTPSNRTVAVRWITRKERREMRLAMGEQSRPVDNLRVLYLAIEAMRMNEVRGIGRLIQDAYMQLSAPQTERDPYELLGLRSDCALEVAEGAYRAMAKMLHPDTEHGDTERMKELNAAIDRIRSDRKMQTA